MTAPGKTAERATVRPERGQGDAKTSCLIAWIAEFLSMTNSFGGVRTPVIWQAGRSCWRLVL